MSKGNYKVILKFSLKEGQADEELRRSSLETSFPSMLAQQPGCLGIELVKIDKSNTMSVQTWETPEAWWSALEAVKKQQSELPDSSQPSILESRDFISGAIVRTIT